MSFHSYSDQGNDNDDGATDVAQGKLACTDIPKTRRNEPERDVSKQ